MCKHFVKPSPQNTSIQMNELSALSKFLNSKLYLLSIEFFKDRRGYDTDLDCSTGIWWSLGVCVSTASVSSWPTLVEVCSFLGWLLANSVMVNRNCMQPTLIQLLWWSNAVPSQPAPLPPIRLELLALQLQGDLGPPWAWLLITPPEGISTVSLHISPSSFLDPLPPVDLPNQI